MVEWAERRGSHLEEATRCDRSSAGISDGALARQLLDWAAEYRVRAGTFGPIANASRTWGPASPAD
jgi:hypothetical protein